MGSFGIDKHAHIDAAVVAIVLTMADLRDQMDFRVKIPRSPVLCAAVYGDLCRLLRGFVYHLFDRMEQEMKTVPSCTR